MDRLLPQDILSYILAEAPDLYTLAQAMRTSRRVYGAYQAHARGISRAVAHNQLGCEFGLALRIARGQLYAEEHSDEYPPEPNLAIMSTGPVSDAEVQRLNRLTWAVRQIENFFSQKYKDRSSMVSRLDAQESRRLVRALYALWLIIDIFAPRWDDLPVPPLTASEISIREALHAQQRAFTSALLPDEDMRRDLINAFMFITRDVTSWVGVCCCNSVTHADILFIFPRLSLDLNMFAHVLRFNGNRIYTPYTPYGHSSVYALREAFNRLFNDDAGNMGAQMPPSRGLGFLNHPSQMFQDACSRCSNVYQEDTYDPELYDSRNWDMLSGDIPLREIVAASFPEKILQNRYEHAIIAEHFEGTLSNRAHTLYNILVFSGMEPTPGVWTCRVCIKNLLSQCTVVWWVDYLRDNGRDVESLETCSAGYDCTMQTTNMNHAQNFNHYKEPMG